jgi:hypothetical protein
MTTRDHLTRFLGSLLMVGSLTAFILIGAASMPTTGFPPDLYPCVGGFLIGAFIANGSRS